jgi:hypothetical protein
MQDLAINPLAKLSLVVLDLMTSGRYLENGDYDSAIWAFRLDRIAGIEAIS